MKAGGDCLHRSLERSTKAPVSCLVMPHIAFVSTFPPRRCGIAQYTLDLAEAIGADASVFALQRPGTETAEHGYPHVTDIRDDVAADYRRAAAAIDASDVEVVSLQHEFGIFGGPDGALVLEFLDAVRTPVVATLHTVPKDPTHQQFWILQAIASRARSLVVLSESARALLAARYGIETDVDVIPHGVPDFAIRDRARAQASLGFRGRRLVLSFGLLGPGKGFEHAIEAMAEVRAQIPDAYYLILGTTHPDLLRRDGEAYRTELQARISRLGLDAAVGLDDRFVSTEELGVWLSASDVFVTPYPKLDQIVSGTLAYALGAGRPVVSTPYAYAEELLSGGAGILVPPADPAALAAGLIQFLGDPAAARRAELAASAIGKSMRWPVVGAMYRRTLFDGDDRSSSAPVRRDELVPTSR